MDDVNDGSELPLGTLSEDGELEVRDFTDASGEQHRGWVETELGQHMRWMRGAPELLEKYTELQAELSSLRSQVEKLRALRDDMLDTARGCRAYGSVPCQCDPSWHAEVYEEWAERISAALGKDSQ